MTDHTDPLTRALDSLAGLAAGDAFGAQYFVPESRAVFAAQGLPPGPWPWTDDTEMACSVVAVLREHGAADQDALAHSFAHRHDFDRGYGPAMNRMLRLTREGGDWRELAAGLFEGQGSYGNGAAMRVAPLGAWFAGDVAAAAREAARSAEVTHTHPEAVAGAVAVAVAAAVAAGSRGQEPDVAQWLGAALELTPAGRVRGGVAEALELTSQRDPEYAGHRLGNGRRTSAVDTVPFTLWCAATHPDDLEGALRACAAAGGDVDTTCAIVGGILAARLGAGAVPGRWKQLVEALPEWVGR
ncbi:ADP-ribosylglycohydrolase family protein [Kitasatospora sp. NPDC002227]|uniref:ADP-ribosylglycohydrolase family protein n=1 Tax=Kitasatospora sp. NPDC002227 TaxID=3154773 RepID=UPI00332DA44A